MSVKALLSALALTAIAAVSGADRANATCAAPSLGEGRYENVNPNTRSITAASLEFVCGSRQIDNGDGTATLIHDGDPHWNLRLWGSCHPSDCDWGVTRGDRDTVGRILGAYDQGFARRNVAVVPEGPGRIQLIVTSHYSDGRATRTWSEHLRLR